MRIHVGRSRRSGLRFFNLLALIGPAKGLDFFNTRPAPTPKPLLPEPPRVFKPATEEQKNLKPPRKGKGTRRSRKKK